MPGIAALAVAHAATLGGLPARSLAAVDATASAPTAMVVSCDNFTGTTGAAIGGRAVSVAAKCANAVWTAHIGSWTVQGNLAASAATANANATLNVGAVNCTVQVVITGLNSAGRLAGVVTSHDGSSTYLAAVLTKGSPDLIELRLYQSGAPTVIASASTTIVATDTLSISRNGASITVVLNGATILNASLNAAQLTALGSGQRSGLFGGNASVRYDNLVFTNP
jgi:hypothetical protein